MLRQQQIAKQQNSMWGAQKQFGGVYQQRQNNLLTQNRGRNGDVNGFDSRNNRTLGLSASAWPTLQHAKQQQQQQQQPQNQQYGSGMRAVFLGNASGKRECAGTGVFLPRRFDSPAESRKKPGEYFFLHAVFLSVFVLKYCIELFSISNLCFMHLRWWLNT